MDSSASQSRKQRRQQLKQEMLAWLAEQPGGRVPETKFRSRVGSPGDTQALLDSPDFELLMINGKIWVEAAALPEAPQAAASEPAQPDPQRRQQLRQDVLVWLAGQPEQMATVTDFRQAFGSGADTDWIFTAPDFISFDYQGKRWLQTRDYFENVFQQKLARERRDRNDDAWQKLVPLAGELMRPDGTHAKSARLFVIARTYTIESAAKRLGFPIGVIHGAVDSGDLYSFADPEGKLRIPAELVEAAAEDEELRERISGNVRVKTRDAAIVASISYTTLRGQLRKAHISATDPLWKQIRGQWGLPDTFKEFNRILEERFPMWMDEVSQERPTGRRGRMREEDSEQSRAALRAEANRLRQQLIEVFPTWDRDRSEQHITLHMGPTNSGKTFSGLNNLAQAGSGWYLSPLRLLAHEVYERMNQRGVPTNLLTGEESIRVEGAQVTAATIEMFNPQRSGACIIIDEAHMLADEQRGWAWTRAIMEAAAPEIHIAGSPVSEALIYRLAEELGFTVTTERYERLTPLHVAERPWTMEELPPRTILVAFSRRTVLGLKSDLEKKFNRSVAVIYGNLPPEVRLRQAERFAGGEVEICVATDAIGMGLNLPADNVCFYEVEKFDGRGMRVLNSNEVKQIAGRAGRYGLSEQGLVGALNKANLEVIRQSVEAANTSIGFAYVAPTPETLALLPGTLDEKLRQWVELKAIPERWRRLLRPVDLSEQILLASMLTPASVRKLGEENALQLVSAPTANNTEPYWLACAKSIIARQQMPIPDFNLPRKLTDSEDLENCELSIRCADVYLWLAQRREFHRYAPDEEFVRSERRRMSLVLDEALAARIDTTRRCRSCGRPLQPNSRYNICDRCYRERRYSDAWR